MNDGFSVHVEEAGLYEAEHALNALLNRMSDISEEGLNDVVLDLKGKSQRVAPLEEGDLRGNATAEVKKTNNGFVGEVGFGEEYALRQHENLNYHHNEGQAKYLEGPLVENTPDYLAHMAEKTRKGIAK